MFMSNNFSDYLTRVMGEQELSINELSRRSGVDQSQISRILGSSRTVMPDTIVKLARGLRRPATEVFCAVVDIIPAEIDPQYLELQGFYESMDEKDRETVINMMQFLLSK